MDPNAQVVRDGAQVAALVLGEHELLELGHLSLRASDEAEMVNVREEDGTRCLVDEDSRISFKSIAMRRRTPLPKACLYHLRPLHSCEPVGRPSAILLP